MANAKREIPFARVEWVGTMVQFTFRNGTVRGIDVATFEPFASYEADVLSAELLGVKAAMHGVEQRLRDSYALPTMTVDGKNVKPTDAEKMEAFMAVYTRLRDDGEWTLPRGAGLGGLLFRAVQEAFSNRFEDSAAFDAWCKSEAEKAGISTSKLRDSIGQSKRVKPILERMQRERTADVDVDSILDDL